MDELGAINVFEPENEVPDIYWNACAALYAYLWSQLGLAGADAASMSQLVAFVAHEKEEEEEEEKKKRKKAPNPLIGKIVMYFLFYCCWWY